MKQERKSIMIKRNAENQGISKQRKIALEEFCRRVNIKVRNIELLDQAFHHRSVSNEKAHLKNNERLEFLGDSVLGMVTATYLYTTLENPEGDLAKIKSAVVSEKALAPVALEIGVDKLMVLGHGEEMTGGRNKPAILADAMEAIIGAYYLDAGYNAAEKYVLSFIIPEVNRVLDGGMKDFKTLLQEAVQKNMKICPKYELTGKKGPDHDQTFLMCVHIGDKVFGPEAGKSKKDAEQKVAKIAFDSLFK